MAKKALTADDYDPRELIRRGDPTLSFIEDVGVRAEVLRRLVMADLQGTAFANTLPVEQQAIREKCLDSPAYFITEVIDPFYKKHFEAVHYQLCDEIMAPYILGEDVRIEGQLYNPRNYNGLLVLMTRDSFKSTLLGLLILWAFLHFKLRRRLDLRVMYVHQVIAKAVARGGVLREISRSHKRFRELFPEFRGPKGEWDRQNEWRWTCMENYLAGEFSFTAYGETSDKTGGHYPLRAADDYESETSPRSAELLETRFQEFGAMENLADNRWEFCPNIAAGTTYHYQGVHARLKRDGGWLLFEVPAFTGSPKKIFALCGIDPKREPDRLERGLQELEANPPGTLNFPKMLGWRKLYLKARALGPHQTNCQLLLNPTPEGEQRFSREILEQCWVDDPWKPEDCWAYVRCDPAISEKRDADETAYTVSLVHWSGQRMFVDGWGGREKDPIEIVRHGFTLARKWIAMGYTVRSIGYEAVQFQAGLITSARRGIPERHARWDGERIAIQAPPCRVIPIERSSDRTKLERILSMAGPIMRREVWFLKDNPVAKRMIQQLENFPHDRDDFLDSMHDHWIKTAQPTPPIEGRADTLHPLLLKLLKLREGDGPKLCDTNASVSLQSWN